MFKKTFGFAPMRAFVDHGEHGTGETLLIQLRPGNASPFDEADHIATLGLALEQLPAGERAQVLVRTDAGGCSKALLHQRAFRELMCVSSCGLGEGGACGAGSATAACW
jgi:hypothetical protein